MNMSDIMTLWTNHKDQCLYISTTEASYIGFITSLDLWESSLTIVTVLSGQYDTIKINTSAIEMLEPFTREAIEEKLQLRHATPESPCPSLSPAPSASTSAADSATPEESSQEEVSEIPEEPPTESATDEETTEVPTPGLLAQDAQKVQATQDDTDHPVAEKKTRFQSLLKEGQAYIQSVKQSSLKANRLEMAIIDGDKDTALELLNTCDASDFGYSPSDWEAIKRRTLNQKSIARWDVKAPVLQAQRLYLTLNATNDIAEHFYTQLLFKQPSASTIRTLFQIYVTTKKNPPLIYLFHTHEDALSTVINLVLEYATALHREEDWDSFAQALEKYPELLTHPACKSKINALQITAPDKDYLSALENSRFLPLYQQISHDYPEANEFETAVINAIPEKIKALASEWTLRGYGDEAEQAAILAKLENGTLLLKEDNYSAAIRLKGLQQNKNHQAEKYFVAALSEKPAQAADNLLSIYAEEHQKELFLALAETFPNRIADFQNQTVFAEFLLDSARLHEALAFLKQAPEIITAPGMQGKILQAARFVGNAEESAYYEALESELFTPEPPTPLEEAVISGDQETACRMLSNPEGLLQMGYTEEQCDALAKKSDGGFWVKGQQILMKAERLLRLQDNLHRQAEKILFMALSVPNMRQKALSLLLPRLVNENRFILVERLYQAYPAESESWTPWLQIRLEILACHKDEESVLNLLAEHPELMKNGERWREMAERHGRADIVEMLDKIAIEPNEFERAVIDESGVLRLFATDEDRLRELAYTEDEIKGIQKLYDQGSYMHGNSDYAIGMRLYQFQKNKNRQAIRFFEKCEDPRAMIKCFELYCESQQWEKAVQAVNNHPDILDGRSHLLPRWIDALYYTKRYHELLAETEKNEKRFSNRHALQQAIALLETGNSLSEELIAVLAEVNCLDTPLWEHLFSLLFEQREDRLLLEYLNRLLKKQLPLAKIDALDQMASFRGKLREEETRWQDFVSRAQEDGADTLIAYWSRRGWIAAPSAKEKSQAWLVQVLTEDVALINTQKLFIENLITLFPEKEMQIKSAFLAFSLENGETEETAKAAAECFQALDESSKASLLSAALASKLLSFPAFGDVITQGKNISAYKLFLSQGKENEAKLMELLMPPRDWQKLPEERLCGATDTIYKCFVQLLHRPVSESTVISFWQPFVEKETSDELFSSTLETRKKSLTDEEKNTLCRLLLQKPKTQLYWDSFLKFCNDLTELEIARAKFWKSSFCGADWVDCMYYVRQIDMPDIAVETSLQMMKDNPDIMGALRQGHETVRWLLDEDYFSTPEHQEAASVFLRLIVDSFKIFDQPGSMWKVLELARNLAVQADLEKELIDLCPQLLLNGVDGKNGQGYALLAQILQKGAWAMASDLAQKLQDSGCTSFFADMMQDLTADLCSSAEPQISEIYADILSLVQVNGNSPNVDSYAEYVVKCLSRNAGATGTAVLMHLKKYYPYDSMLCSMISYLSYHIEDEDERYRVLYDCLSQYAEGSMKNPLAFAIICHKLIAAYWLLKAAGLPFNEKQNPLAYFMDHCGEASNRIRTMQSFYEDCEGLYESHRESPVFLKTALYGAASDDWLPFLEHAMNEQAEYAYTNDFRKLFNGMESSLMRGIIHAYISVAYEENENRKCWLEEFSDHRHFQIPISYFSRIAQNAAQLLPKQYILRLPLETDIVAAKLFLEITKEPPEEILSFFTIMAPFQSLWNSIWEALKKQKENFSQHKLLWEPRAKTESWWHSLSYCCTLLPAENLLHVYEALPKQIDDIDLYEWYCFAGLTAFDHSDDAKAAFLIDKGMQQYKNRPRKNDFLSHLRGVQIKYSGFISSLFIHEKNALERLESQPPNQCINMVAQLLSSVRAQEYRRLLQYLSPIQKAMARCVWECMAGRPEEALLASNAVPETDEHGNRPLETIRNYLHLFADKICKNTSKKKSGNKGLQKAYQTVRDATEISGPPHFYLLNYNLQLPSLNTTILPEWLYAPQKPLDDVVDDQEEIVMSSLEIGKTLDSIFDLPYVQAAMEQPSLFSEPVDHLEERLKILPNTEYAGRAKIFASMLTAYQESAIHNPSLVDNEFLRSTALAALKLGMNLFEQLRDSSSPVVSPEAESVFFQAVSCADKIPEPPKGLCSNIRKNLFPLLLQAESLEDAIAKHNETKNARKVLCSAIKVDEVLRKGLSGYFQLLEKADVILQTPDDRNTKSHDLRRIQSDLKKKISFHNAQWNQLSNKLYTQIDDAIISLNNEPRLEVKIFNHVCHDDRRLYGEVGNKGGHAAETVSLYVHFIGYAEKIFRLNGLAPQEHVPFSIRLPDTEDTTLAYDIYTKYLWNEEHDGWNDERETTSTVQRSEIKITPLDEDYKDNFCIPFFDPNSPTATKGEKDDGDEFIGREEELRALKMLFLGAKGSMPSFARIPSCMIYGLKRSGKTSLLKQVQKILKERGDILLCFVNAQGRLIEQIVDQVFIQEPLKTLIEHLEETVSDLEQQVSEQTPNDAPTESRPQSEAVEGTNPQQANAETADTEAPRKPDDEDADTEALQQAMPGDTGGDDLQQAAAEDEDSGTVPQSTPEDDEEARRKHDEEQAQEALEEARQKLKEARDFRDEWMQVSIEEDPNQLTEFYKRYAELCEPMHLVVSVDEVEKLFGVAKESISEDAFFGTLRSILQWQYNDVHFLFCGSDQLTTYIISGTFSQFFQNITQRHIRGMNRQDTLKVIRELERMPKSCLKYYEGVPELIWHYTGGMIWHVKLLLYFIGERLCKEWRSEVYPSDVTEELDKLIADPDKFRDFAIACTDDEKIVLKALADCQKTANMSVSFEQICAALPKYLPEGMSDERLHRALRDLETRTLIKLNDSEGWRGGYSLFTNVYRLRKRDEYPKKFVLLKKEEYDWDDDEEEAEKEEEKE